MPATLTPPAALPDFDLYDLLPAPRGDTYDAGYSRALRDLLDSLVFDAEQFLGERANATAQTRKTIYAFVAHLERHLLEIEKSRGFVEGGLGI